jgi:hypothetical protein
MEALHMTPWYVLKAVSLTATQGSRELLPVISENVRQKNRTGASEWSTGFLFIPKRSLLVMASEVKSEIYVLCVAYICSVLTLLWPSTPLFIEVAGQIYFQEKNPVQSIWSWQLRVCACVFRIDAMETENWFRRYTLRHYNTSSLEIECWWVPTSLSCST